MTKVMAQPSKAGVLFSDLEFQAVSGDADIDNKQHRCQVFDIPTLLFDKKWLGTDEVSVELFTSSSEKAEELAHIFKERTKNISSEITHTANRMRITDIEVEAKVQADPLLSLVDHCLWLEPNKLDKIAAEERVKIEAVPFKLEALIAETIGQIQRGQKFLLKQLKRLAEPQGQNAPKQANEKGKAAFERLEKKKNLLVELGKQSAVSGVSEIHVCTACEQVIAIYGRKKGVAIKTPEERAVVEKKLDGLEGKISAAKGTDNKQKRKKLKRRLQKYKHALGKGDGDTQGKLTAPTKADQQESDAKALLASLYLHDATAKLQPQPSAQPGPKS